MISLKDVAYLSEDPKDRLSFKSREDAVRAGDECASLFKPGEVALLEYDAADDVWRLHTFDGKYLCMESA